MSLLFPSLVGQGWSVHKKPKFDVRVAPHATGREARAAKFATPMWDFELTFDGLDMTATGDYGALGAQSMQTLAGFFLQCQGKANPFVYIDPTDSLVTGGAVATGDGVTTSFTLARPMGAYSEPVGALVSVNGVYFNGAPVFGWIVAQPNVLTFGTPPPPGAVITADFKFGFVCRFTEDVQDFEEFMAMLSAVKTLTFQSVRDIVPLTITALRTIIIQFPVGPGEFCAPPDWNNNYNRVIAIGGGAGGGHGPAPGGGGGAYTYRDNVQLDEGQCVPIEIGAGGGEGVVGGVWGIPGVPTTFHNPGDPSYVFAMNGGGTGGLVQSALGGLDTQCIPGPPNAKSGGGGRGDSLNLFAAGSNGGGGAGGPFGPGADGGSAGAATGNAQGGAGGGAADGGSVGANAVSSTGGGGQGGTARDGTPGGATYYVAGKAGDPGLNGSGGGGGCSAAPPIDPSTGAGGNGSTEPIWFSDGVWYGPGSGGAGAGGYGGLFLTPVTGAGGAGGKFGGGGGGGQPGGAGSPGALVIIYLGVESSS